MKKLFRVGLLTVVMFTYIRCEDQLDINPASLTEEGFFVSEEEFEKSVFGVYQKLIFFYNYRGGSWLHDMWLLPGDDLTSLGSYPFETFATINASNGDVTNYYRFAYQLIARANIVLEKQVERADVYENATLRDTHKGEVLFLRGLMNFKLYNAFETAPLVTNRIADLESSRVANATGTQLLDQAIADFKEAATLLPDQWDDSNVGRASAGAAHGFAGKALLYRATITQNAADYTESLNELRQVTGYSLEPVFGDNFDETLEHNQESIFEIQFGKNNTNNVWLNNDSFGVVGDLGGYWGFFDNHWSLFGSPTLQPTESLKAAFEDGDPRIADTFEGDVVKKYVARPRNNGQPDYHNNARLLRYADVLLLQAEAINESGGSTSEALALVNQVRARARNIVPGGTVPADFDENISDRATVRQLIMDERRRELAFEEGNRWYDLKRWHQGGLIDLTSLDFSSVRDDFNFDVSTHLRLPLPASELVLNANLAQNAGY
ncbi:MAG: RagB/SusD family nutrient uptake outer membrane protein [Bacteroidota bacterium]